MPRQNNDASPPWKDRHELPVIKKLDLTLDIDRLRSELAAFSDNKKWDSLGAEYASLCETHTRLPKMFFKPEEIEGKSHVCEMDWDKVSYQQLSLTEYDPEYSLKSRQARSGSVWDQRVAKRDTRADERWFGRKKEGIPTYLSEVLSSIVGSHRARFAQLAPHCSVKPHFDYDTLYGIRIHIALTTNEGCRNGGWDRDGREVSAHIPADGSVWFVNPGVKHYAVNEGDTARTHLILSVDSQELISTLS